MERTKRMPDIEKVIADLNDLIYREREYLAEIGQTEPSGIERILNDAITLLKAIKPVKKPSYESRAKAPCTCGKKHPTTWYGVSNTGRRFTTVKCNECGKSAEGITEIDAIRAWNAMVKGE